MEFKENLVNFDLDSHDEQEINPAVSEEDMDEEDEETDNDGAGYRFSFGELMEEVRPPISLPKKSIGNLKEALEAKFAKELQKVESQAVRKLTVKRVAKMRLKRINKLCQKKEKEAAIILV